MASTSLPDERIRIDHRDLIELLPDSILCRFDRQLRVVFAGGDALHKLHHTPEELVGQSVQALLPQEAWAAVEAPLRAALTGECSRFEVTYPAGEMLRVAVAPLREGDEGAGRHVLLLGALVSGRAQAEDRRRGDRERLEAAIQAANVGLWDWDLYTNKVHYSTEWKRQIGYEDDEIGDDLFEWESRVHPDDLQRAKQTVECYVAAPWPNYQQEFRFRHRDGSYLHILAQAKMYHDKDGRPAHMVGSHVDITQAIAREEALRESEARYRTLFEENHSVMLLIHRETGDIFDANPAAAAFYGWTREQLRTMSIFINAASPAEVKAEIQRAEAEQRNHGWFRHRLADGSLRDVEVYTSTVELNGRVLRHAIAYDMTKRKQAEDALVRSEAALKRSQAVAHIGHWTWDTRSNTVTLSDELRHVLGLDSAMDAGDLDETIRRAIHPDDVERLRAMVSGVLAEQQVVEVECRVVWPDGSVHYVLAVPGDRTLDAAGHIVQLSGVVQDETERKLREVEREELLLQLQDKAEQLAQVMRSVPEGVLLLDNGSKVLLANPRAEAMLALLAAYDEEWRLAGLGDIALDALLTSPPAGQWHTVRVGQKVYEVIARPVESGPVPGCWCCAM